MIQAKPTAQNQTQKVKVLRAFYDHEKKVLTVGEEVTLPLVFAQEMRAANKVAFVEEETTPVVSYEEPKTESRRGRHAL